MKKYVPPSLRKAAEPTFDESYPVLTSNLTNKTTATTTSTFADKAREWEQQRIQREQKIIDDARIAEFRLRRASRQAEEDAYITKMLTPASIKRVYDEPVVEAPKAVKLDSDWVVIEKKIKKKKEFDYSEPTDDRDIDISERMYQDRMYHDDSGGDSWV